MRFLFLLLALSLVMVSARGQSGAAERIQAVIHGPMTSGSARAIGDRLSQRPGVLVCRVDPISHNFLLEVDDGFHLSRASIERYFAIHGSHLRCYRRGPRGDGPFLLLDPTSCGSQPFIK